MSNLLNLVRIQELKESQNQKQKHFITQSKKLSEERDEAVKTQTEIQEQCQEKMEKYDDLMADINKQLLESQKQIGKNGFYELENPNF